ncbi:MAG TPA: DUF4388 domain-containing protein [Pyrinomonadaceae bacterium]|jgi:hypothetical protein
MQSTSFVALTGHLNDYPLADLIGILRRQRKTGRLLIEYSVGPCSLYFMEGMLVDAQLNSMGGLQAVLVALSQSNASFNFNPLIHAPRRSISESSQKVILELLGCWDEKTIDVETAATGNGGGFSKPTLPEYGTPHVAPGPEALPRAKEVLALPPSSIERANRLRHRRILIASAIISLLVSLLTVAALTRWLIKKDVSAMLSEMDRRGGAAGARSATSGAKAETIKVFVRVEKGRVTAGSVEEHRPGMEAYEATALRIARARRYDANASGRETLLITINAPE